MGSVGIYRVGGECRGIGVGGECRGIGSVGV